MHPLCLLVSCCAGGNIPVELCRPPGVLRPRQLDHRRHQPGEDRLLRTGSRGGDRRRRFREGVPRHLEEPGGGREGGEAGPRRGHLGDPGQRDQGSQAVLPAVPREHSVPGGRVFAGTEPVFSVRVLPWRVVESRSCWQEDQAGCARGLGDTDRQGHGLFAL